MGAGSEEFARALAPTAVVSPARRRVRAGVGAVIVLAIAAVVIAVFVSMLGGTGSVATITPSVRPSSTQSTQGRSAEGAAVYIHILGAVNRPGLYRLQDGARGFDAVAAAGGFAAGADEAAINLARFVTDGEQLVVPLAGAGPVAGGGAPGPGRAGAGALVDLNTATVEELDTLPRIGPSTAARIIEWREANGGFASVDDLSSVTGIGEKTLAGLRDLVTV